VFNLGDWLKRRHYDAPSATIYEQEKKAVEDMRVAIESIEVLDVDGSLQKVRRQRQGMTENTARAA